MLKIRISYENNAEGEAIYRALASILCVEKHKRSGKKDDIKKIYITGKLKKYD